MGIASEKTGKRESCHDQFLCPISLLEDIHTARTHDTKRNVFQVGLTHTLAHPTSDNVAASFLMHAMCTSLGLTALGNTSKDAAQCTSDHTNNSAWPLAEHMNRMGRYRLGWPVVVSRPWGGTCKVTHRHTHTHISFGLGPSLSG